MKIIHEKDILDERFPFELWVSDSIDYYPHWHEGIEIVYQLNGRSRVGVNELIIELKERDILFISKGDIHYFLTDHATGEMVILQFEMSIIDQLPSHYGLFKLKDIVIDRCQNPKLHEKVEKEILEIKEAYFKKSEMYGIVITARLHDMISHVLVDAELVDHNPADKSKELIKLEKLEKIFDFVAENFQRRIDLEEAASQLNYSTYHFTRYFKKITGMTFLSFLNRYRVNVAKGFLLDTDISVTEVAQRSGFRSIKTFNRVFKEISGCTPTDLRSK